MRASERGTPTKSLFQMSLTFCSSKLVVIIVVVVVVVVVIVVDVVVRNSLSWQRSSKCNDLH